MTKSNNRTHVERIVIAVTCVTPVQRFWQEARQFITESRAELHALLLEDARWHRAASLPFTREIPRHGGTDADFTAQRAEEVHKQSIERIRRELKDLAKEQRKDLEFEVLRDSDRQRIMDIVSGARCVVIAPETFASRPEFEEIRKIGCRVIVVRD
jgi:hypothetical protein